MVDKAVFPGMQGGPLMHTIAAKAVCLKEALQPSFKEYNRQIVRNAKKLADILMDAGLRLVSGGTDNHLILIDLTEQGITGLEAETALGKAGITVNKNTIPREARSPFITSGLRIGTPAITTRGMKEAEMEQIGTLITRVLKDIHDDTTIRKVKTEVVTMASRFPIYPENL
jgi:glycine hydroxymethyltransferase